MKRKLNVIILSYAVLVLFGILSLGCSDKDTGTKKANTLESETVYSQPTAYTLSASQLHTEYNSNEVAADIKYKGKVVMVSGTIQNIGKDIMDQAYVVIGGKGFLDGVQCTFTKVGESAVARLSKGQDVKIKGQVAGKMGNVLLNKCSLQ